MNLLNITHRDDLRYLHASKVVAYKIAHEKCINGMQLKLTKIREEAILSTRCSNKNNNHDRTPEKPRHHDLCSCKWQSQNKNEEFYAKA